MNKEIMIEVGKRIKRVRKHMQINQKDFAAKLGIKRCLAFVPLPLPLNAKEIIEFEMRKNESSVSPENTKEETQTSE